MMMKTRCPWCLAGLAWVGPRRALPLTPHRYTVWPARQTRCFLTGLTRARPRQRPASQLRSCAAESLLGIVTQRTIDLLGAVLGVHLPAASSLLTCADSQMVVCR